MKRKPTSGEVPKSRVGSRNPVSRIAEDLKAPSPEAGLEKAIGIPTAVSGSLLASGFPFQTAVADAVRKAEGWKVLAEEWPWQDGGADRFLDVVASKGEVTLAIEAKKSDKEVFTFLSDGPKGKDTNWWRGVVLTQIRDSTARMELECRTWQSAPSSPIAKFCVVATSKTGGDQRLLERDAQLLLRGTKAYGLRFRRTFRPGQVSLIGRLSPFL